MLLFFLLLEEEEEQGRRSNGGAITRSPSQLRARARLCVSAVEGRSPSTPLRAGYTGVHINYPAAMRPYGAWYALQLLHAQHVKDSPGTLLTLVASHAPSSPIPTPCGLLQWRQGAPQFPHHQAPSPRSLTPCFFCRSYHVHVVHARGRHCGYARSEWMEGKCVPETEIHKLINQ